MDNLLSLQEKRIEKEPMNKSIKDRSVLAGIFFAWVFAFISAITLFVPLNPLMPTRGLDPSWAFGLNQLVAQGFNFGHEVVFTFGPYAAIYTRSYHPFTDFMAVAGSLYLAIAFCGCSYLLMRSTKFYWIFIFYILLVAFVSSIDCLLFSIPLMVGLVGFKMAFFEVGLFGRRKTSAWLVFLVFAPFGLLVLIKGTLIIGCGAVTGLCVAFFVLKKRWIFALVSCFTPGIMAIFFWQLSGQSAINLFGFFNGVLKVTSGYSDSMSLDGNPREVLVFLSVSILFFLSLVMQKKTHKIGAVFLLALSFIYLFLSFKAGFVRHDSHAVIAADSLIFLGLLLPFVLNGKKIAYLSFVAFVSGVYINNHYNNFSAASLISRFYEKYHSAQIGLYDRVVTPNLFKRDFEMATSLLKQEASFPNLSGTTDIYSYNQSFLIASGNIWSPRPIFQSLVSYTPVLADLNRAHLLGMQSPDNIIFSIEPIDNRIPSADDGVSWPVLLEKYQPKQMTNDFLFLQKKTSGEELETPLHVELAIEKNKFGEDTFLPNEKASVFAQIEIKRTFLGLVANFLLRTKPLQITFKLESGVKKVYRVVPGMVKSGFLISPLIENTFEFGMLYADQKYLKEKLVKSFNISLADGESIFWSPDYVVTFSRINKKNVQIDLPKIFELTKFDDKLQADEKVSSDKCFGSIDVVNHFSPPPAELSASGLLLVRGWFANSVDPGLLPDSLYVVLTDSVGRHFYFKTRKTPRPDVSTYFQNFKLNESGFALAADIASLHGIYTIELASKRSGKLSFCPQFKIQAKLK
ncbi:MAG: hypothetical protein WA160_13005 [Pseudobdellovibrio sp.]